MIAGRCCHQGMDHRWQIQDFLVNSPFALCNVERQENGRLHSDIVSHHIFVD